MGVVGDESFVADVEIIEHSLATLAVALEYLVLLDCVVLAYADIIGLEPTLAATISAPFGGGMGRLREVCGAVSGMTMVAGFLSPCPTADDPAAKKANYALVQRFAEAFREQNGAIVCRTLLGLDHAKDEPTPSPRTAEYYRKRPCAELVGDAARIVGEYLEAVGY